MSLYTSSSLTAVVKLNFFSSPAMTRARQHFVRSENTTFHFRNNSYLGSALEQTPFHSIRVPPRENLSITQLLAGDIDLKGLDYQGRQGSGIDAWQKLVPKLVFSLIFNHHCVAGGSWPYHDCCKVGRLGGVEPRPTWSTCCSVSSLFKGLLPGFHAREAKRFTTKRLK